MSKKLGFALSAGGSRGCAHIGFLKAMDEEGIKPDFISGCSMGSVIGAGYASGLTPEYMQNVVTNLKKREILDVSLNPFLNGALMRSEKIREKLKEFFGDLTFEEIKIPFTCVATDLVGGKTVVLGGKDNLVEGIVASSSIPIVFKPVKKENMSLVDGGLLCRVPVEQVYDMGAEVVVAVDVLGTIRREEKRRGLIGAMFRMFDVCDCQMTKLSGAREKADLFIEPDLGEMLQYKFDGITQAIECGYKVGKFYADKIKELIAV